MGLKIEKYERVPFDVDAVLVTEEDMEEIAKWCGGEVRLEGPSNKRYIKVHVVKPLSPRQTKAFAGDWVLFANKGHKVYTPDAFEKSFVKKPRKKSHGRRATPADFGSRQEVTVVKVPAVQVSDEQLSKLAAAKPGANKG